MPLIEVKMTDRRINDESVSRIITALTDALCDALQEDVRDATWVVVEGVPAKQWGIAGKPLG
jgi:4-oxalocrotonate tautomerase